MLRLPHIVHLYVSALYSVTHRYRNKSNLLHVRCAKFINAIYLLSWWCFTRRAELFRFYYWRKCRIYKTKDANVDLTQFMQLSISHVIYSSLSPRRAIIYWIYHRPCARAISMWMRAIFAAQERSLTYRIILRASQV